jgi:hypothetical protein
MWKEYFKTPPDTKVFGGEIYTPFKVIEITKEDAVKTAKKHRAKGWLVRIVKFSYCKGHSGYVLYAKRKTV